MFYYYYILMVQSYNDFCAPTIALIWHSTYQTIGNRIYNVTFTPKVKVREAG